MRNGKKAVVAAEQQPVKRDYSEAICELNNRIETNEEEIYKTRWWKFGKKAQRRKELEEENPFSHTLTELDRTFTEVYGPYRKIAAELVKCDFRGRYEGHSLSGKYECVVVLNEE